MTGERLMAPPGAGGPAPVRLLHVLTVPESFVFLRGQLRYMHERGFRITGVSSAGPYQAVLREVEPIALETVEMPRRITPLDDLRAVGRLVAVIRRVRPHIVHAHTPKGGLLGMLAAWIAGVPVRVYHMRGLPMLTATGLRRRLLRWSERAACACAHRVVCVSHSLRAVAIAEGLTSEAKIVSFLGGSGNGVDAGTRFAPVPADAARRAAWRAARGVPADAVVIAFVGRLVRDKGVVELADAWATLRERHPEAWLVLAGGEEPQDPVPGAVLDRLRADARVRLVGPVAEPREVYAAADVVALPSYREGFPNVPLEAAAMALPVVSTRVPGCMDAVVDGVTGLLVPAGDAPALAHALARYVSAPELRARHGAAGRDRALRDFDRPRIWAALHAEYLRLLEARGLAAVAVDAERAAEEGATGDLGWRRANEEPSDAAVTATGAR